MKLTLAATITAGLLAVMPSSAKTYNKYNTDHMVLIGKANVLMHTKWHADTYVTDVQWGKISDCKDGQLQAWVSHVTHIITLNENCNYWDDEMLNKVLIHETGHLLLGQGHSVDRHSIMFKCTGRSPRVFFLPINYFGQKITKEDRARLQDSLKYN